MDETQIRVLHQQKIQKFFIFVIFVINLLYQIIGVGNRVVFVVILNVVLKNNDVVIAAVIHYLSKNLLEVVKAEKF